MHVFTLCMCMSVLCMCTVWWWCTGVRSIFRYRSVAVLCAYVCVVAVVAVCVVVVVVAVVVAYCTHAFVTSRMACMAVVPTGMAMPMRTPPLAIPDQPLVSAAQSSMNRLQASAANSVFPRMNSSLAGTHGQFYFGPGLEARGESAGNGSRAQSSEGLWPPGHHYGSS